MLNFYGSIPNWASFSGYDLVPEMGHEYEIFSLLHRLVEDTERNIIASSCEKLLDDGSIWTLQRIGKLESNGGYDWWQFGWNDAFHGSQILRDHPQGMS